MEHFEKLYNEEKREKPEVLYVAAHVPGISELVPRRGNFRDEKEGAVIFSTPDKALASVFLVEGHGDHWMQIGYFEDILVVVINADKEEFVQRDRGGFLYAVSGETFDCDPHKGMGEKEWTSTEPVRPLSETRCPSALEEMLENGVQVYFVDKATFDKINNADDHGLDILSHLESENDRRGKNIKSLRKLHTD